MNFKALLIYTILHIIHIVLTMTQSIKFLRINSTFISLKNFILYLKNILFMIKIRIKES